MSAGNVSGGELQLRTSDDCGSTMSAGNVSVGELQLRTSVA